MKAIGEANVPMEVGGKHQQRHMGHWIGEVGWYNENFSNKVLRIIFIYPLIKGMTQRVPLRTQE